MWHFIRLCTVSLGKNDLRPKKIQYLVADEINRFQLLLTSPLINKSTVGVHDGQILMSAVTEKGLSAPQR